MFYIRFDSSHVARGLVSRYSIPKWMQDQYFEESSTIYHDHHQQKVPLVKHCQTCDAEFASLDKPAQCLCPNKEVNRKFGYVAKVCVPCVWYFTNGRGDKPKLLDSILQS